MERDVAVLALTLIGAVALALLIWWIYRLVHYRKALRRSQARWLAYDRAAVLTEDELGLNWPHFNPMLLSPIPEELHESGRESENESMLVARKDSFQFNTIAVIAYGSFENSVTKTATV